MAKKKKNSNKSSGKATADANKNNKKSNNTSTNQNDAAARQLPNYMSPTKASTNQRSPRKKGKKQQFNFSPSSPKRIFLIRHGESMGQAAHRLGMDRKRDARLLDCGLTPKGIHQAEQLVNLMDNVDVDVVISSPLTRAIHTALVGFPTHSTIVIHKGLAELGSRVPENKRRTIREVQKSLNYYLEGRHLDTQTFSDNDDDTAEYEPKSNKTLELSRIMREDIARMEGDTIAIACHYCIIQTLLPGEDVRPKNALPIECTLDSQGRLRLASSSGRAEPMDIG